MPDDERRSRWPGFDFGGGRNGPKRWRFSIGYLLIGLVALFFIQSLLTTGARQIPYSEFLARVEDGSVQRVAISEGTVDGAFIDDDGQRVEFAAIRPPGFDDQELLELLRNRNIEFTGQQPSAITSFLFSWILPILFLVLIWTFLFRRMAGGGAAGALNLGKRGVKIFDRKDLKTTFTDVAGVDEAVEELKEIVEFLSNPKKYQRLGGRIPKGVLLMGPPGCGKTLLARAVAGEAGVPFFYMSGSEFVEMFVGLGAARVRELFQQAKEKAPVLIFIDEIDTIGKSRVGSLGAGIGSHDEREQTLTQLLSEMDGFDTSKGVIIMAATNRPDVLDPALLRPGRFDRQVMVDLPDLRGREAILGVHARGVALAKDVDLNLLAARTPMLTGADLANIINEAALLAARREKNAVGMAELEEAIDRVTIGLERKSRVMSDKERELAAFHEMGHALVALAVPNADPVHRVTIIPRGPTGGVTIQRPLEDRHYLTESYLKDRLAIGLGGRTAEELAFGEVSSGASNDLQVSTEIARAMVVEFGMSDKLGPLSYGQDGFRSRAGRLLFPGEAPQMADATEQVVDEEVARLVNEARGRATKILTERRRLLDQLARLLMERETIDGADLEAYVSGTKPIPKFERVDASGNGARRRKATVKRQAARTPRGRKK
ncbi:MAG: ATP-dependent zinc metalloprotease FtsH [Actinomycetota bacterium]